MDDIEVAALRETIVSLVALVHGIAPDDVEGFRDGLDRMTYDAAISDRKRQVIQRQVRMLEEGITWSTA